MSVNVNANFKYSVVAGAVDVVVGVAHVVTLTGAHV